MTSDLFIYPVCLLYSCTGDQFHSFSALTTEITLWWCMHVCQYIYVLCVFPHYGRQVTAHFMHYSPPFQFQFLSRIIWNFFYLVYQSHSSLLSWHVNCQMMMKEKCPCIVHVPHFQAMPLSCMSCCRCRTHTFPVFAEIHDHIVRIFLRILKFVNFWSQTFHISSLHTVWKVLSFWIAQ